MGFYASGYGYIEVPNEKEIGEMVSDCFEVISAIHQKDKTIYDVAYYYDKYHDDDVKEILEDISKIGESEVMFSGEDGSHWKFVAKDGKVKEFVGDVIFDDEDWTVVVRCKNCRRHSNDGYCKMLQKITEDKNYCSFAIAK